MIIKIAPDNQDMLKRRLDAILFPIQAPKNTAAAFVTKEDKKSARPLTSPKAAPKPTANPSKDKAIAKEKASANEILLE